jgi:hypothetical protein
LADYPTIPIACQQSKPFWYDGGMKTKALSNTILNNRVTHIALGTLVVLSVPLIVMQFTDEVRWGALDFAAVGALLFVAGLLYVLAVKKVKKMAYRAIIGIVIVLAALYLWAEMAVGIFTNWGG